MTHHLATEADRPAPMGLAIAGLQRGSLSDAEIATSFAVMGLDSQLVGDRMYFIVEADGVLAGCGG
jgi:hypothetical protein